MNPFFPEKKTVAAEKSSFFPEKEKPKQRHDYSGLRAGSLPALFGLGDSQNDQFNQAPIIPIAKSVARGIGTTVADLAHESRQGPQEGSLPHMLGFGREDPGEYEWAKNLRESLPEESSDPALRGLEEIARGVSRPESLIFGLGGAAVTATGKVAKQTLKEMGAPEWAQRAAEVVGPLGISLPNILKSAKKSQKPIEQVKSEKPTVKEQISFKPEEAPKPKINYRQKLLDELDPLKKFTEEATQGGKVPITQDPYKLARLMKGVTGKAESFIEYATRNVKGEKVGKGLFQILDPHAKELEGLSEYIAARRAQVLEGKGIETGMDAADVARVVKDGAAKFEKTASELQKYNHDLLDYAKDSGLLNDELASVFKKDFYAKFKRLTDGQAKGSGTLKTPPLTPKSPFFKIKGSKKPIVDPLESMIDDTYRIITASDRNRVNKAVADLIKKNEVMDGNVKNIAAETEESFAKALEEPNFFQNTEDGTITYFENGKKVTLDVPKEVAESIKGMTPQEFSVFDKMISFPTRFKRATILRDPTFLARSFQRDVVESFIYSKYGMTPVVDPVKGIFEAMKKGEMYQEWKAAGGAHATRYNLSREANRKQLSDLEKGWGKKIYKNPLEMMEAIGETLEAGPRIAEHIKARQSGATPEEAALASREITIDFSVRGNDPTMQLFGKTALFFNPTIQGASKFATEIRTNPKAWLKGVSGLSIPTTALWYYNKDNPRYKELPDWQKHNYWHFFSPLPAPFDHMVLKKPDEIGQVFGTLPEVILNYINDRDPKAAGDALTDMVESLVPNPVPEATKAWVEHWANKKFFTGSPIVPQKLEKTPPDLQELPKTTKTAKAIARWMNQAADTAKSDKRFSPLVVDHYLDAWGGPVGGDILRLSEWMSEITGATEATIPVEKMWSEKPFFEAWFGKEAGRQSKSIRDFYDISNKLESEHKRAQLLKKKALESGKSDEADIEHTPEKQRTYSDETYKKSNKLRKALNKQWKYIQSVETSTDDSIYTPEIKRKIIEEQVAIMVDVTREFNKSYKQSVK